MDIYRESLALKQAGKSNLESHGMAQQQAQ